MDGCPFCHAEVSEDLVRFGGACPSCLGEIPGEEAATDPGEAARQAQIVADRRVVQRARWVIPSVVGAAVGSLLCFAVWTVLRPVPTAPMLDFDDVSFAMDDAQFVAYVEPEPEPEVASKPVRRTVRSPGVVSSDPAAPTLPAASDEAPTESGPRRVGGDAFADATVENGVAKPQAGAMQLGLDVGVARRATKGVRLTDDSAIVEMIKRVMTEELPRLKSCYEQRLKVSDGLSGRWVLAFVVGREGEPRDIAVTGSERSDHELEACIAAKVAKWDFQPIRADQPVQKTLAFRPGI